MRSWRTLCDVGVKVLLYVSNLSVLMLIIVKGLCIDISLDLGGKQYEYEYLLYTHMSMALS